MSGLTEAEVLTALSKLSPPGEPDDIVKQGMVSGVYIKDTSVTFSISVPAEKASAMEPLRKAAQRAVEALDGVEKVMVVLTAERQGGSTSQTAPSASAPNAKQARPSAKAGVPGIEHIIAVASGKGGVGKSTSAVNIALALSALGKKVGILDADVYGPSLPRMLGLAGSKPESEGRLLHPLVGHGIKVMSIGFLVEEATPMVWRGPMVISALTQMLREVLWGELDILVVDMPPGTGDAQLTMSQQVPLSGAVIISTPQDIALIDARKGLNMFNKVEVPILGIVENMSYFLCPSCGDRSDIFGHGGAREEAATLGVPFLGEVPLHMDIRANSDGGTPVVTSDPEGDHALVYKGIAEALIATLSNQDQRASAPKIVFE
ncbi:MAG: iron-sulfur cluster carrier protein ApbC [Pseudomonadota bacterium]